MVGFGNKFQLYRVPYKSHKKLLVMGVLSFFHTNPIMCVQKKKKKKNILGFWEYLICGCFKGVDGTGTRNL